MVCLVSGKFHGDTQAVNRTSGKSLRRNLIVLVQPQMRQTPTQLLQGVSQIQQGPQAHIATGSTETFKKENPRLALHLFLPFHHFRPDFPGNLSRHITRPAYARQSRS